MIVLPMPTIAGGAKVGMQKALHPIVSYVWWQFTLLISTLFIQLLSATEPVSFATFSPDGRLLVGGNGYDPIKIWRIKDGKLLGILKGQIDWPTDVAFSPDGKYVIVNGIDLDVKGIAQQAGEIFWVQDMRLLRTFRGLSLAFSPNGQIWALKRERNLFRFWLLKNHELSHTLKIDIANTVAFSPEWWSLASGERDGTIKLWRIKDARLIRIFKGHKDRVQAIAFSPDGQILASADENGAIRLWQVKDGKLVQSLSHHELVTDIAFSPNGKLLAIAGGDVIKLWRVKDNKLIQTLKSQEFPTITFSPDSQFLAIGGMGSEIRLWRIKNCCCYLTRTFYAGNRVK